ncbi:uncharacterized protein K02A2.6-like [Sycon ciliatum]|uniref:uncharacterized protein K02A2.6-like n=1 Tax=Sycon ciliatum TaxID=27933 RepID=UPI0031F6B45F
MGELTDTTEERLDQLIAETKKDSELQLLKKVVEDGWPETFKATPPCVRRFWSMRDRISYLDGILFVGERFIVPASMQQYVLRILHESHQGVEKCKYRASECVYWPGIQQDIEDMVKRCPVCQRFQPSNCREPMLPHEIPKLPWTKLGSDILEFNGRYYLVVADYTSKYPEVNCLGTTKTSAAVITKLKNIFSRHGIPEVMIADNMPYASKEMKEFAKEWQFKIVTSSPTYSQSNGKSENVVKIVKRILKKALEDHSMDPEFALLNYRNTRISGTEYSPAQVLMGRRLRDRLPMPAKKLEPKTVDPAAGLQKQQARQEYYYNRTAKERPEFRPGDDVLVRERGKWTPSSIREQHEAPRSYILTDGRRRTSRHLRTNYEPKNDDKQESAARMPDTSDDNVPSGPGSVGDGMTPPEATDDADRLDSPAEPRYSQRNRKEKKADDYVYY